MAAAGCLKQGVDRNGEAGVGGVTCDRLEHRQPSLVSGRLSGEGVPAGDFRVTQSFVPGPHLPFFSHRHSLLPRTRQRRLDPSRSPSWGRVVAEIKRMEEGCWLGEWRHLTPR